jgi:hypothetical protein
MFSTLSTVLRSTMTRLLRVGAELGGGEGVARQRLRCQRGQIIPDPDPLKRDRLKRETRVRG